MKPCTFKINASWGHVAQGLAVHISWKNCKVILGVLTFSSEISPTLDFKKSHFLFPQNSEKCKCMYAMVSNKNQNKPPTNNKKELVEQKNFLSFCPFMFYEARYKSVFCLAPALCKEVFEFSLKTWWQDNQASLDKYRLVLASNICN